MKNNDIKLWILVEKGLTGTANQLKGVVDKLQVKQDNIHTTWHYLERGSWLMPRMDSALHWDGESKKPDLVLAAGRLSILPALMLKLRGIRTAYLQDPRFFRSCFDVIYCPAHDPASGENVVNTDGAANRIEPCDNSFEKGAVSVLLGGGIKGTSVDIDDSILSELADRKCYVTFSRRTPDNVKLKVRAALNKADIYDPADGGTNPYRDYLCRSEFLLVTNDSVSMVSDACSTGRSVYIYPFIVPKKRHKAFQDHIVSIGAAKLYDGAMKSFKPKAILNDADKVATDIAQRFFKP